MPVRFDLISAQRPHGRSFVQNMVIFGSDYEGMTGRGMRFPETMSSTPEPDVADGAQADPESSEDSPTRSPLLPLAAIAAAAFVVLLVILNPAGSDDEPDSASGLEQFQFETVSGESITLAAYEGQPLVVNYFASWCAPCRAELPAFNQVSAEVAGDGIVFVGISRDNDVKTWQSFVEEVGVDFDTIYEGANTGSFEFVDAKGMPTTVFIRADGSVAEVFSGLLPEATLQDKIDQHLMES